MVKVLIVWRDIMLNGHTELQIFLCVQQLQTVTQRKDRYLTTSFLKCRFLRFFWVVVVIMPDHIVYGLQMNCSKMKMKQSENSLDLNPIEYMWYAQISYSIPSSTAKYSLQKSNKNDVVTIKLSAPPPIRITHGQTLQSSNF